MIWVGYHLGHCPGSLWVVKSILQILLTFLDFSNERYKVHWQFFLKFCFEKFPVSLDGRILNTTEPWVIQGRLILRSRVLFPPIRNQVAISRFNFLNDMVKMPGQIIINFYDQLIEVTQNTKIRFRYYFLLPPEFYWNQSITISPFLHSQQKKESVKLVFMIIEKVTRVVSSAQVRSISFRWHILTSAVNTLKTLQILQNSIL